MFTERELEFIGKHEVCRLATCSDGRPHVVPVCYIFSNNHFYIATDYATRKFRNVLRNRSISLVIDTYRPNRAVMVEGTAEIVERGEEFREIYRLFYSRFEWVRREPWGEGEAPFIKVSVTKKVSWGL
ncbi:MAG: pyridoxamine 5'-phosphate oxidase family protein [Candidatus Nitrosocaldus sp.]|nr:pyridoxamine 5'-phosphate oxidase family protein [Candidatus Nitrosocaldus sp.]MCS7140985.1 pyridoxamine 5'-phosphate oxidase family protein [Candidatus Nitrosocaldus sp.]MDW7999938.1 pyridoxamine 5'-phosphate oxidase family protein [Candidatus Nitrosocaldus sp.]MDW8275419.1 pyridoxamine 5'-phosphate oxidase family protein [Candidatus Nitrosocaldus sp.]